MSDESPRPKKGGTVLKDTFLKWPFAKDFVYDVTTDGKVDNVKCIGLPCTAVKGNVVHLYLWVESCVTYHWVTKYNLRDLPWVTLQNIPAHP